MQGNGGTEAGPSREASDQAGPESLRADTERSGNATPHGWMREPSSGSRRGSDDKRSDERIKSRAVNDLGWNWEAERAQMEGGQGAAMTRSASGAAAGSGSGLGQAEAGTARANTVNGSLTTGETSRPPISPRGSSKGVQPPRIDTATTTTTGSMSGPAETSGQQPSHQAGLDLPTPTAATVSSDALTEQSEASQALQGQPRHQQQKERSGRREQSCDACGKPMTGQFVRALGVVFHLDCFRCKVGFGAGDLCAGLVEHDSG